TEPPCEGLMETDPKREPPRCEARRKGGAECRGWAVRGTTRCRMHLGKRAAVALVEHKAQVLFGQIVDEKPVSNPLDVYAEFTGRVMAWMKTIDGLVRNLESPRY